MKSTKTKRYVVEKKFRERYTKIQLRSSSQRSTKLPFESGTSRAISAVAILLCLSFLVSLVLQYWSVRSCNRKGLQETKQELLFHSNQDQLSSNLCVGGVSAPLRVLEHRKYRRPRTLPHTISSWLLCTYISYSVLDSYILQLPLHRATTEG